MNKIEKTRSVIFILLAVTIFFITPWIWAAFNNDSPGIPVGVIADGVPGPYAIKWVKLLDERNRAEVVRILFASEGERGTLRDSTIVTIITALPQMFMVDISDGAVIEDTGTFTPPIKGVPRGPEMYSDLSGNGRYSVALFKDGVKYAFYLYDKSEDTPYIIVLDWSSASPDEVTSPEPRVIRITYSGKYVLIGDGNGYVACYESTEAQPNVPPEPFAYVSQTAPPGIYIAAGGETGNKAFLYSFDGTKLLDFLTGGKITSVAISDDGRYVVIGSEDNKVYYFTTNSGHPKWKYQSTDDILAVDISSNGSHVVAGDKKGNILFWSNATYLSGNNLAPNWTYGTVSSRDILDVSISDDGTRIGAGGVNNRVYFLNDTGKLVLLGQEYTTGGDVKSVAVSNDGKYLVAGSDDEWVYFFGDASDKEIWKYHANYDVKAVAISYYGDYVAAATDGNEVYFFDSSTKTPLWEYSGHGWPKTKALALSYSGRYLAIAASSTDVYFFDTRSGSPLWNWKTPGKQNTISMTFDGNILTSGGDSYDVNYWFGAKDIRGVDRTGSRSEGEGPAWYRELGGKVNSIVVNTIYGPGLTVRQNGLSSLVISSDTQIVYVDKSNNMYVGTLAAVVDTTSKRVWDLDARSFFPSTQSGTVKKGDVLSLLFTYPGEALGLGTKPLPTGTYSVYAILRGIAKDGVPFTQRIECGTVTVT